MKFQNLSGVSHLLRRREQTDAAVPSRPQGSAGTAAGRDNPAAGIRDKIRWLVDAPAFRATAMTVIVLNAIALGLETSPTVKAVIGSQLHVFDQIVIAIFCVEIGLRIIARGLRFFRDPWGIFDFIVVAVTLAPASDSLLILRALRVLRVLRVVSAIPRLRRVVGALLHAVPGVAAIAVLLLLIFYVYAVITTNLFGTAYPVWFGTIGESMFSLFQIMTLESWSMGIVRPILQQFPWAWTVFVSFIIVSSFTVLNLFIAIVIDSMQTIHSSEQDASASRPVRNPADPEPVLQELRALRKEFAEFRARHQG